MSQKAIGPILVLDDDSKFRQLVACILETAGYKVVQAASAKEASAALVKCKPVLAMVDYILPNSDGISWITELREAGKDIPVVFVSTSLCDQKTMSRLRETLNVSMILRKPISPSLLLLQMENLLPAFPPEADSIALAPEAVEQSSDEPEYLESHRLRKKAAMKSVLERAKADYVDKLPDSWANLVHAVSKSKSNLRNRILLEDAAILAHKIKGTAGSFGFSRLGEIAGRIEQLIPLLDPDSGECEENLSGIFRALAQGEVFVKRIAGANQHPLAAIPSKLTGSKILILSKDEELRKCARIHNIENVTDLVVVGEASQAEKLVHDELFDGAILDFCSIAKEDGLKLARGFRAVAGNERLPIAFVCPRLDFFTRLETAYVGSSLNIAKPISVTAFKEVISRLIMLRQNRKPRILIIDDDLVLSTFIAAVLSVEGMIAHCLDDPANTRTMLELHQPDLVLLDVVMPGVSGYDVCRLIRSLETWAKVPVIFLTAKSTHEERTAAFSAGGNDFLTKPIVTDELLVRVKGQLSTSAQKTTHNEKDSLTGALLLSPFVKAANYAVQEVASTRSDLTVCLITVNHNSKDMEERMQLTEQVFGTLGKLIQIRFKSEDIRGRWNDSGFAIVFPGEREEVVYRAMERLKQEFRDFNFPHYEFSSGLANYPTDGNTIEELMSVAYQRLVTDRKYVGAGT